MINWNTLISGLGAFALGLIMLGIKNNIESYDEKSYLGAKMTWSIYGLFTGGVGLIIYSFL